MIPSGYHLFGEEILIICQFKPFFLFFSARTDLQSGVDKDTRPSSSNRKARLALIKRILLPYCLIFLGLPFMQ